MTFEQFLFGCLQFGIGLYMLTVCLLMAAAFLWAVWTIGKTLWRLLC